MLNPEHVLIPFQVSPLPPGPWLVFAPHADDETFGMGGSILKAKNEGIDVHLVILTDGSLGGDQINLVEIRKREAEKVSKILGLKSLNFWDEPDRALAHSQITIKKAHQAILDIKPATVYFPGPLEIHPDHRTTAFIIWDALQRARQENICPEPISYEISVQNPINMLINISDEIKTKKKAMNLYVSQNGQNNYSELVLALDKGRTFSLPNKVRFAEGFFRYQIKDLDLSLREITKLVIDLYL
ncbi:MAG: PIG-L family deacetylase [Gammaproteobacteria bacterium]|nr:PIG-L family deacetylase [Gammaproteobacteria bacterium]